VDAHVMCEFMSLFNDAWCIPFQIVGALVGVSLLLGTASLGAIVTLVIMMYVSSSSFLQFIFAFLFYFYLFIYLLFMFILFFLVKFCWLLFVCW
jgi:hypothetical protein